MREKNVELAFYELCVCKGHSVYDRVVWTSLSVLLSLSRNTKRQWKGVQGRWRKDGGKKRKEKERNSDMIHKQENDPLGRWLLMGIYLSRDGKNNLIREGIENTSLNY